MWNLVIPRVLVMTMAVSLCGAAELPLPARPDVRSNLVWELTDSRVVNVGKEIVHPKGVVIEGRQLELTATSSSAPSQLPGKCQMTLALFSPAAGMPGQKPGRWYVSGAWVLAGGGSDVQASGTISAELNFDPMHDTGKLRAVVFLKGTSASARRIGRGSFIGNEKFEGTLSIR